MTILACLSFSPHGDAASPNADPRQSLRTALLDHELYVRDSDAARTIAFHWDGSEMVPDVSPGLLTLAAFMPSHIDTKHDVVIIEGTRRSLLRDGEQITLSRNAVPVKLILRVSHADQAAVLPHLPELLFFASREQAIAAVPSSYRAFFPAAVGRPRPDQKEKCDCADAGKPACEGKSASLGLKQPRLLSQVDPEFSEEARRRKFSGDVGLVFTVDLTGHPVDLWLTRAVGLGLDEKAAEAARQYVFQPGLCHGEAAAVPLAIDVNFQIF